MSFPDQPARGLSHWRGLGGALSLSLLLSGSWQSFCGDGGHTLARFILAELHLRQEPGKRCVCACVRTCVCACVCARVFARVCACVDDGAKLSAPACSGNTGGPGVSPVSVHAPPRSSHGRRRSRPGSGKKVKVGDQGP